VKQPVWAGLVAGVIGLVAATAFAASTTRPTVARCVAAWNAASNAQDRQRVVALDVRSASMRTGTAGVDTWSKGGGATSTTSQACLLTLVQHTTVLFVAGLWSGSTVSAWRFGHSIPTTHVMPPANVRVRPDGRLSLHVA
jgi:hypothetical protein